MAPKAVRIFGFGQTRYGRAGKYAQASRRSSWPLMADADIEEEEPMEKDLVVECEVRAYAGAVPGAGTGV